MTDLAANALTSLAAVSEDLGITLGTDKSQLARFINAASDMIEGYCNRKFARTVVVEEKVAGRGEKTLLVERAPLVSIEEISYDGTALDEDGYEIHNAGAGIIYNKFSVWSWDTPYVQGASATPYPAAERKLYAVSYTGGFLLPCADSRDLPYDLEQACIDLVVSKYNRKGEDPNIKSEKISKWSATYGDWMIPPRVQAILNIYRRAV